MKILRTVLYILLALVAIFLILALIAPKEATMNRSVEIDAPPALVFEHIGTLEAMAEWSPWFERDTAVQSEFTGDPGTVGSQLHWKGNDQVGEGKQTITKVVPNELVSTEMEFIKPNSGSATADLILEETENGSKVTWDFHTSSPFPMNAMNLFLNFDKILGPEYEKGLAKLKAAVDQDMQGMKIDDYNVNVQDISARHYVGVKDHIDFEAMDGFFQRTMGKVANAMNQMGLINDAVSSAIYWTWDEETKKTELMGGMYTNKDNGEVAGLDTYKVDGGKAVVIEYQGDYEQSYAVHTAADKFLKKTGYESTGICMEDYVVGPGVEEDASKWVTRVVYPIK